MLPFKPDGIYLEFLEELWRFQYTPATAPLTDRLVNKFYDLSGGIPAYIVRIFQESQVQVLLSGQSHMTEKLVQKAVDILAIKLPKTYSGGTFLSDFEVSEEIQTVETKETIREETAPEKRRRFCKSCAPESGRSLPAFVSLGTGNSLPVTVLSVLRRTERRMAKPIGILSIKSLSCAVVLFMAACWKRIPVWNPHT